jgi:hypothetical protein
MEGNLPISRADRIFVVPALLDDELQELVNFV